MVTLRGVIHFQTRSADRYVRYPARRHDKSRRFAKRLNNLVVFTDKMI
jgi:hypothetical protein